MAQTQSGKSQIIQGSMAGTTTNGKHTVRTRQICKVLFRTY